MSTSTLFMKRFASFIRSMRPVPPPNNVESILNSAVGKDITDRFIDLYYSTVTEFKVEWRGHELLKNPCDLWMYIELIKKIQPKYIIETGTHHGASALYYSDMTRLLGIDTTVITIDINPKLDYDTAAAKVISLRGMSTSPKIVNEVKQIVKPGDPVIVMLDSDHSEENVTQELNLYSEFVSVGSYVIVEDSIVNGHPSFPGHGPGPFEAAEAFVKTNPSFQVDLDCQKFLLTYNNRGYLKRIA